MDLLQNFYGEPKESFESRKCVNTAYEIAHQPLMWAKLCEYLKEKKPQINAFMDKKDLKNTRIILTGAGSSGFAGRAVAGFTAQAVGLPAEAIHTTDIVSAPDMYFPSSTADKPLLLISFARSGNSPESVGAVEYARKKIKNLSEIAIVCDGNSKLAETTRQSADALVLVMPEGTNDKGFAMTSSVSSMILAGFAVLTDFHKNEDTILNEYQYLIDDFNKNGKTMMKAAKTVSDWDFERTWYLGSGPLTTLVHEGALKMMELTNGFVVAGHNSATEFRHGPKTVLNPKTLTVHFISNNKHTARYDTDLLNELYNQRDGNKTTALHNESTPVQADLTVPYSASKYTLCADVAVGLQGLLFMQLLSSFTSVKTGIPTDNPSPSGLVNRVVQGVTVYPC
jgi:tagatose-6-phosphate ketose/aldose isomerase